MIETHDTIDGLLAEFRGYSAGMPPSYHVTMSWADFRKMLDRFEAAHGRERGDAAKLREALKKCLLYIASAESVGIGTITLNDKVKLYPKKIIKSAKEALAATKKAGGAK